MNGNALHFPIGQHVEQKRGDPLGSSLGVDAGDRLLERRRPVLRHSQRLAVEHDLPHGELEHDRDDPRESVRDVVEIAGIDAYVVVAPVDLDPDAVELPLDGRSFESGDCVGDRQENGRRGSPASSA